MNERKTPPSRLRQEHMEHTRDLILEGLIRTMANGAVTWSIPDVARESGVSVPTIYRYFRTKQELVEGLGAYVVRKAGFTDLLPPHSPQELIAMVRQMYLRAADMSEAMKMASLSELAQEIRKESIPLRLKMIETALAPVLPFFAEHERIYLVRMVLLLSSSALIRALDQYLGLTGAEAADTISWAFWALTRAGSADASTSSKEDSERDQQNPEQ
ncbi:TetR/AcrR family transcriptional regulator [Ktedonobacter racemifer]|nr:TetR/AcrR family transcriptional regulator [Ktedonobacter racemifer]